MSTNITNPGPTSPSSAPPAPDPNIVIHPSLNSIMIGHTFLTLLLPLLIALFYYSTPYSRRQLIFILNVLAVILAFIAGIIIDTLAIHSILSLQDPWPPSVNIAIGIIGSFQSMLVDLTLLVRLISVNPLSHLGLMRFAILISLPVLLKIGRLVNMIIFIKVLADAALGPFSSEYIAVVWETTPYLKIEWSAQVVDNAYASLAFLWTIRDRGISQGITSNIHPTRTTFTQRMRTLSRITLSNFLIPSLFSIAQLVVVYHNINILIVNDVVLVNNMLAVFGVVFATVWAGNANQREAVTIWDGSRTMDGNNLFTKRHPRVFDFPGLGTWRVASPPPILTSVGNVHTGNVESVSLSALGGTGSENWSKDVLAAAAAESSVEVKSG